MREAVLCDYKQIKYISLLSFYSIYWLYSTILYITHLNIEEQLHWFVLKRLDVKIPFWKKEKDPGLS
jgi:hypothetical protein